MDALLLLSIVIIGVLALAYASVHWGVDTRPCLPDDHRR